MLTHATYHTHYVNANWDQSIVNNWNKPKMLQMQRGPFNQQTIFSLISYFFLHYNLVPPCTVSAISRTLSLFRSLIHSPGAEAITFCFYLFVSCGCHIFFIWEQSWFFCVYFFFRFGLGGLTFSSKNTVWIGNCGIMARTRWNFVRRRAIFVWIQTVCGV